MQINQAVTHDAVQCIGATRIGGVFAVRLYTDCSQSQS